MADLFESIVKEKIRLSIIDAQNKVKESRDKARQFLLDFYEDNQHAELSYIQKYGFHKKRLLPLMSSRLTQRVINKHSLVYKETPIRTIVGTDGKPTTSTAYSDFLTANPGFQVMKKKAERYHTLLNNHLFRWTWSKPNGFVWYIEHDYEPVFGSENKIYPIGYKIPMPPAVSNGMYVKKWLCISDEDYFFVDAEGDKSFDPAYPDGKNPYGIMPIVDYTDYGIDKYWGTGAKSLVEANQNFVLGIFAALHGVSLPA